MVLTCFVIVFQNSDWGGVLLKRRDNVANIIIGIIITVDRVYNSIHYKLTAILSSWPVRIPFTNSLSTFLDNVKNLCDISTG